MTFQLINNQFILCFVFSCFKWNLDILYLNKQRQKALEELNRTNREKELLLEKIELLEAKKQGGFVKGDYNLTSFLAAHGKRIGFDQFYDVVRLTCRILLFYFNNSWIWGEFMKILHLNFFILASALYYWFFQLILNYR